jgi:hypothetical protein
MTNTDVITSQSHSRFACSREQIRLVENSLKSHSPPAVFSRQCTFCIRCHNELLYDRLKYRKYVLRVLEAYGTASPRRKKQSFAEMKITKIKKKINGGRFLSSQILVDFALKASILP